jgi:futalosine hydrolase
LGKANAAMALGAVFEALTADLVLVSGVGGAYPCSGLAPGDLAVASVEVYGDEGVETSTGFRQLEETAIPLWESGSKRYFNRFPVDPAASRALEAAAGRVGRCQGGAFVTVSTVTGTRSRARDLAKRFGAVCENMEGAAAAHAAVMRDIPFAEVRGISNVVGPRDRASWKLEEAAAVCQRAVLQFLKSWQREKSSQELV